MNRSSCIITSIRIEDSSSPEDGSLSQINQIDRREYAPFVKQPIYKFLEPKPVTGQSEEALLQKAQNQWAIHAIQFILNTSSLPFNKFSWTTQREKKSFSILITGDKELLVENDQLFTAPCPFKDLKQKIAVVFRSSLGTRTVYSHQDLEKKHLENSIDHLLVIFWNTPWTQLRLDPETSEQEIASLTYTKLGLNEEPLNPNDRIPGLQDSNHPHSPSNGQSRTESVPNVANTINALQSKPTDANHRPPLPPKNNSNAQAPTNRTRKHEDSETKSQPTKAKEINKITHKPQRSKTLPPPRPAPKQPLSNSKTTPSYMAPTKSSKMNQSTPTKRS